jgi:hypothetical protein
LQQLHELQCTKETENYAVIYSGVNRYTSGQSGVMMWAHKSIPVIPDYCKFCVDRIREKRLKTHRGKVFNNIGNLYSHG